MSQITNNEICLVKKLARSSRPRTLSGLPKHKSLVYHIKCPKKGSWSYSKLSDLLFSFKHSSILASVAKSKGHHWYNFTFQMFAVLDLFYIYKLLHISLEFEPTGKKVNYFGILNLCDSTFDEASSCMDSIYLPHCFT